MAAAIRVKDEFVESVVRAEKLPSEKSLTPALKRIIAKYSNMKSLPIVGTASADRREPQPV